MRPINLIGIFMAFILVGCVSAPPKPAVTAAEARRLLCASITRIRFAYTRGQPAKSDTLKTIEQIRRNNAARKAVCDPKKKTPRP